MAQQTGIEWLIKQLDEFNGIGNPWVDIPMKFFIQAKEKEKEQILDAYEQGAIDGRFEMFSDNTVHNAEAYYNKTFSE